MSIGANTSAITWDEAIEQDYRAVQQARAELRLAAAEAESEEDKSVFHSWLAAVREASLADIPAAMRDVMPTFNDPELAEVPFVYRPVGRASQPFPRAEAQLLPDPDFRPQTLWDLLEDWAVLEVRQCIRGWSSSIRRCWNGNATQGHGALSEWSTWP